jgi:hydroxyacylglutathione hydrolase
MTVTIIPIPYFDDNYAYLIHDAPTRATAVIDCGDAGPILDALERHQWVLNMVLLTHSHYDHAGDIEGLLSEYPAADIIKPAGESRISAPGREVTDRDRIPLGNLQIEAVLTPAHTRYCTCYHVEDCLFVGDTLFSAGCGRLFEGTASDLEKAMDRIAGFPDETQVFVGHEYTLDNLRFAQLVEPQNHDIERYRQVVSQRRREGLFSTPTTIAQERKVNPFLRCDQPSVTGFLDADHRMSRTERIGLLRQKKDDF